MQRLSAVDAISPAFTHAKRLLFGPFRLDFWARMGMVSLLTGEFAGGSSGGSSVNIPASGAGTGGEDFLWQAAPVWQKVLQYLPWVVFGIVVLVALVVVAIYIASVFRFVLFDAVLTGRAHLTQGWHRWQEPGGSFFLWQLGFGLSMMFLLALVIGLPIYLAFRAGIFRQPNQHVGLLVLGGLGLLLLLIGIVLLGALVHFMAKDFVVPLMALENLGVLDAWQRLLPMLTAEKWGYAGYVLMKIVLTIASAILFGIVNLFVVLIMAIILAVVGAGAFFVGKAIGLTWALSTLALVVILASLAVMIVLYAIAFVSSPAMVFFQAYAIHFFSSRYQLLATHLTRSPGTQTPIVEAPEPT
jgi:hypothetical protein